MNLRYKILILMLLLFSVPIQAQTKQHPWAQLATNDLKAIQEALSKHSAPAAAQDANFNKWLEVGYQKAMQLVQKCQTFSGYEFAIRYYVAGFKDSHIHYYFNITYQDLQYPGFLIQAQGNKFLVGYKDATVPGLDDIVLGREVIAINDIPVADFIKQYVQPYSINGYGSNHMLHLAPWALVKTNNPYAMQPTSITLRDSTGAHKIELKFGYIHKHKLAGIAKNLSFGDPSSSFLIKQIDEGAWVAIPSFSPTFQKVPDMEKLLKDIASLRSKKWVVFDMRGNGGGNSDFERALIRNFYGDAYLKSLGQRFDYNHTWIKKIRATAENFASFKTGNDALEVARFENTLKKGHPFYTYKWSIFDEKDYLFNNLDEEPVQAKVYILTDGWCGSTCWLFVNEMLQIPGVIQIGEETSIQTPYSQTRWIPMPSGLGELICPMQVRIFPNKHLGHSFKPKFIFSGDWSNQESLEKWVLQIVNS